MSMRKLSSFRYVFALSKWKKMPRPYYCPFQTHRLLFSLANHEDLKLLDSQRNNAFLSSINTQQYACYSAPSISFLVKIVSEVHQSRATISEARWLRRFWEASPKEGSIISHQASTNTGEIHGRNGAEVNIISKQKIKPAFPTPCEWKTYKISILDQLNPNTYLPTVHFFHNNHQNSQQSIHDLTSRRRQLLKQSLSHTLRSFYPLAGKIHNNQHIDCNDDGVYYVEAQVNDRLSSFLESPDHSKMVHNMLPFRPNSFELLFERCGAMVQVNIFECGGIAIGVYTSQKIMDKLSHITFLRAWAERASGSSEQPQISPSNIAPTLFLQNPDIHEDASLLIRPTLTENSESVTKRFLFHSSSLNLLKEKAEKSSDITAVMGLIWKCAMKASEENSGSKRSSILSLEVDLRARSSPPLWPYALGNISWSTTAQCTMTNDDDRELKLIVGKLQNANDAINADFVEGIKGEKGSVRVCHLLNESRELYSNEKADYLAVTSLCNAGVYEPDFGWGKPTLACVAIAATGISRWSNRVILMDSRYGSGVEACVTLSEEHMEILERDSELLQFASLLPN